MKDFNLGKAFVAGWAATLTMTVMMVNAPSLGMPRMDMAAMLGSLLAGRVPAPGTIFWVAGLFMHLVIGTVVLSTVYGMVKNFLPSSSALAKGLAYGAIVWIAAQVMVMPMMGAGFFSMNAPQGLKLAMGSLMGHWVYGAILGSVYGSQQTQKTARPQLTLGL